MFLQLLRTSSSAADRRRGPFVRLCSYFNCLFVPFLFLTRLIKWHTDFVTTVLCARRLSRAAGFFMSGVPVVRGVRRTSPASGPQFLRLHNRWRRKPVLSLIAGFGFELT